MNETIGTKKVDELIELIDQQSFSKKRVQDLVKALIKGKPLHPHQGHKPKASPVTHLTDVIRTYTCITCGSRWTHTIQLTQNDSVCGVDKNGKVHIITSKGPYQLDSWVKSCSSCASYIAKLTREELEELAMSLLVYRPYPPVEK